MLNNVMLIKSFYSICKVSKNECIISLVISGEDGDFTLPVTVNKTIADIINKFFNKGNIFGIKNFISVNNNQLCVIASKTSFISKI